MKEQKRKQYELKNCTFRPHSNLGLASSQSATPQNFYKLHEKSLAIGSKNKQEFFEKLASTGLKKYKAELAEKMKAELETELCTFQPNLGAKSPVRGETS